MLYMKLKLKKGKGLFFYIMAWLYSGHNKENLFKKQKEIREMA